MNSGNKTPLRVISDSLKMFINLGHKLQELSCCSATVSHVSVASVRPGSELCCRVGAYLQVAVHLIQSVCLARYTIQDSATIHTYSQELAWQWCWVRRGKYLTKCSWKLLVYVITAVYPSVCIQCTLCAFNRQYEPLNYYSVIFWHNGLFLCITQFRIYCYSSIRYTLLLYDTGFLYHVVCSTTFWILQSLIFLAVKIIWAKFCHIQKYFAHYIL